MNEITASIALIAVLLALLAGGVWVGLTLAGVAWAPGVAAFRGWRLPAWGVMLEGMAPF